MPAVSEGLIRAAIIQLVPGPSAKVCLVVALTKRGSVPQAFVGSIFGSFASILEALYQAAKICHVSKSGHQSIS
jgi:hypothetical protein